MEVVIDYETRSAANLKKTGATKYAQDPTTEIICVAWKVDDGETELWYPIHEGPPTDLIHLIKNHDVNFVAHNAGFEQAITEWVLFPKYLNSNKYKRYFSPGRWICTAAKAASHALPRSLGEACIALKLPVQKDMEGRKLILKYCKPRRSNSDEIIWWDDMQDLERLGEYCKTDVEAEYLLHKALPNLTPMETAVWRLDQTINKRGLRIDEESINIALELVAGENEYNRKRIKEISNGEIQNATQRAVLLDFVNERGAGLADLRAGTIKDALKKGFDDPLVTEVLEIRQASSKTSTAKFQAFLDRMCDDGRVRDLLVYHGASTGRWAGSGVQPQNFPKGNISNTDRAIEIMRTKDVGMIKLEYGDLMTALSSCLRGMIVPSEGRELYCADYAAIEARVAFWLVDNEEVLQIFRDDEDLYVDMASLIFGCAPSQVDKSMRQLGKIAILALQYGMGKKKFFETCAQWGSPVSEELAAKTVTAYRTKYDTIVSAWRNIERAACLAVAKPGRRITINKTTWFVENRFLYCELPSGRRLAYPYPRVVSKKTPWGAEGFELRHWARNSLTRKWEETGTYGGLLFENICQAVSRDLMAEAMLKVEAAGYPILISVHDELLAEKSRGDINDFNRLMSSLPQWARGLPLSAEGWSGPRYKK
jgi:DNA polymerase